MKLIGQEDVTSESCKLNYLKFLVLLQVVVHFDAV